MDKNQNSITPFTSYQKFIIAIVALVQFTVVLDFMVISPLSPILMKSLSLNPTQFGFVGASYAFSAFFSAVFVAGIADKYDRKKFLLVFYVGFIVGTLFCAIAPSYGYLLAARVVTGLFGGVIGAIGMAIVTDLFEINQRGRVFGFTQMGFSASQVLGIPLSLVMATRWGWNSPFYLIVVMATVMGIVMLVKMQPVTKHLSLQNGQQSNALPHLVATLKKKKYQVGFLAAALLPLGGFMLMPFGTAFAEFNMGVAEGDLWIISGVTGIASLAVFPIIGRLSDRYDKLKIFAIASIWSIVMVIVHTNWGLIPMWLVLVSSILMFAGIMGRIVPSTILISAIPEMKDRGAFMSINSSLQYLAGGIASVIASFIVTQETPTSALKNFNIVGFVVAGISLVSIFLMSRVYLVVKDKLNIPKGPTGAPAPRTEPVLATE
jgi:predicted MFS family arabinose efflux permease